MRTTITLPPQLSEPLEQLAEAQGASVQQIVEDMLTAYLREQRHIALQEEMDRFRGQHAQLLEHYHGQFIGLYQGRVLDADSDGGVLYARLYRRYRDLPILIVQVNKSPEQEFVRLHRRLVQ